MTIYVTMRGSASGFPRDPVYLTGPLGALLGTPGTDPGNRHTLARQLEYTAFPDRPEHSERP